jgi:hypothetical protein
VGDAVGQTLPFAVGVAVSPLPIVVIVLILVSPRARPNGLAFLLGTVAGVVGLGAALLVASGPAEAPEDGDPATWVGGLKLALGLLLLALAVRGWRGRAAKGAGGELPRWMGALETMSAPKALGAGLVLNVANPKNVVLVVAATTAVAETGAPGIDQASAWAVFTALAALGVALPVGASVVLGERATEPLLGLKAWMIGNQQAILAVLFVVIGAQLLGDGLSILSS